MDRDKQCVLVIIGADAHGNKDIVAIVDGYRESAHDDVEKELARLRKENELLRQERDLLKKMPRPSSLERQVDEVPVHRREEGGSGGRTDVCTAGCQRRRLLRLAALWPASVGRYGLACPYSCAFYGIERNLWQPPHACGFIRGRFDHWPASCRPTDAR